MAPSRELLDAATAAVAEADRNIRDRIRPSNERLDAATAAIAEAERTSRPTPPVVTPGAITAEQVAADAVANSEGVDPATAGLGGRQSRLLRDTLRVTSLTGNPVIGLGFAAARDIMANGLGPTPPGDPDRTGGGKGGAVKAREDAGRRAAAARAAAAEPDALDTTAEEQAEPDDVVDPVTDVLEDVGEARRRSRLLLRQGRGGALRGIGSTIRNVGGAGGVGMALLARRRLLGA